MSSSSSNTPAPRGRIDGLDGLRALSIIIVLIGHAGLVSGHPRWLEPLKTIGVIGVELFFAISGFIITLLMVRERDRTGRLNLAHFWARRALRILPPLMAMSIGVAIASDTGVLSWSWPSFLSAWTFTHNLQIYRTDWFFGHTWSLSMEEQFYAIWPMLFVRFYARRACTLSLLAVIATAPVIALICEFHWAPVRNLLPFVPYLAAGCLLALLTQRDHSELLLRLEKLPHRCIFVAAIAVAACIVSWLRNEHWMPWLWVPLDALLMPASVFLLLAETVQHHGRWTRLLSWLPLRRLGLWSYSIYLWQQLFFGPADVYRQAWILSRWPYNIAAAMVCGALSYAVIERGSGRLKSALKLD